MKKSHYAGLFVSCMIAVCFSVAANENDFQRLKEFARQIPMECDYNAFFEKLCNKYREDCKDFESYSDRLSNYNTRKDQCLQEIYRINSRIQSLQSEITNLQNIQRCEFEERDVFSQRQDKANRRIIEIQKEIQALESKKYTINTNIDSEPAKIDDPSKQFKFRIEEHPVKIVLNKTNYSISRFDIDNKCFICDINEIQLYNNELREGEKNFIVSASIPSQKIKLYFDDAITAKNFKEKYLAGENIVLPSAARIEIDYYLGKREVKAAVKRLIRPAVTRKKTITIERNNIGKKAAALMKTAFWVGAVIIASRNNEDLAYKLSERANNDLENDREELLRNDWRMRDQTREVDEVVIPAEYEETPAEYQDDYRYQLNFTVTLGSQYNWNQIKNIPASSSQTDSNSPSINNLISDARNGDINAQVQLGKCYYDGNGVAQDYNQAVLWYRKAAEQGNAEAQNYLGMCYYNGKGVEENLEMAFNLCQKAAKQGVAEAQFNLGLFYENGYGVNKDLSEAIEWYKKAAQQGDVDAQTKLGECYYDGNGVARDYNLAVFWYHEAAKRGNAKAQNYLGVCYYNGKGVEENLEKAIEWCRKAAAQGLSDAQDNLRVFYQE